MSPVRPDVTVIGRRLVSDDYRLRDFLTRIAQPFRWLDSDAAETRRLLAGYGLTEADLPVVLDGEPITSATVELLVERWAENIEPARKDYDLVIVGAGPAGLAAAVYAASDGLTTLVLESEIPGGQASHTAAIENFFGFPEGIGGAELARRAGRQAEQFGAELLFFRGVTGSHKYGNDGFAIEVTGGYEVRAPVVIAAPGMEWRRLDIDGIDELLGRGIYYGAGRSEAAQCGGDDVVVVGAGNSAGQAVIHLGNAGARVKMIVRGDRLGKSMSAYLVRRIEQHPMIELRLETEVESIDAKDGRLAAVTVRGANGATETLPATALFLCIGGQPRTAWARENGVSIDRSGYLLTGPDLLDAGRRPDRWPLDRDPLAMETSIPGLFAAGDVRHGSAKRVAGAVGDGATAVAMVHWRLQELMAAD